MNTKCKVILLTGASSGIGYDAAIALARYGHKVYAAARRVELMEPLRNEGIVPLRMDVTDEQSMQEGVRHVVEAEGRIDVLVNNACHRDGGYGRGSPPGRGQCIWTGAPVPISVAHNAQAGQRSHSQHLVHRR